MATLYHLYDPKVQKANYPPPQKLIVFNYILSNNVQIVTNSAKKESEHKLKSKQTAINLMFI